MIAIDSSALVAIALTEPSEEALVARIAADQDTIISAVTLAETLIVADRRGIGDLMRRTIDGLGPEVVPATEAVARRAADAYGRWGKGVHCARLNLVDCFSYVTAKDHGCPLLFVGDDFTRTDVTAA